MTHTLLCVCVWVENSIIQPWKVCESSEWVNVWSCVKADEDQIRQKDWSSSSCFVLVKQMHKSMCFLLFPEYVLVSMDPCLISGTVSFTVSTLLRPVSISSPPTSTQPNTSSKSKTTTHTALQPNIQQLMLTLYRSCQNSKKCVKYVSRATGEKSTHKTELPS